MPNLEFDICGVEAEAYAAVPTMVFRIAVSETGGTGIDGATITTQVRLDIGRRSYGEAERTRLWELFGSTAQGLSTPRSLLWTHGLIQVPAFTQRTVVPLPITCTYDFEVTTAKYFHGVDGADIPLEFLFSGNVLFRDETGALKVARLSWDKQADYRLPAETWKNVMDHYFPRSAWIRLDRDTFDRLYRYRTRHGFPTWDTAMDQLLPGTGTGPT